MEHLLYTFSTYVNLCIFSIYLYTYYNHVCICVFTYTHLVLRRIYTIKGFTRNQQSRFCQQPHFSVQEAADIAALAMNRPLGVQQWGIPQCMVYLMENPIYRMDD